MTDDERPFLEAILCNPNSDAERLTFADWLEEQGQVERAEFIRCQAQLARWPDAEYCPMCGKHWQFRVGVEGQSDCRSDHRWYVRDHRELVRRERELLLQVLPEWISETSPFNLMLRGGGKPDELLFTPVFRRGFVASITCTAADWLQHGRAIVRCQPVEEVRLTDKEPLYIPIQDGRGVWVFPRGQVQYLPNYFDDAILVHHESEDGARASLSDASLAWARQEPCPRCHGNSRIELLEHCPQCRGKGSVDFRELLRNKSTR